MGVLLTQLGYPSGPPEVLARLEGLDLQVAPAWVAVSDGHVVALATAHIRWRLESDAPSAELTALVVDQHVRSSGTGARLLEHVEAWAVERGCLSLSVASSMRRDRAHEFYLRNGFEIRSKKFEKNL